MTITIKDILTPERAISNVAVTSKKKLLEQLAKVITEHVPGSNSDDVFERLLGRERLGSTGLGEGIAIPHCRLKQCQKAVGVLFTLTTPIDYDAVDKQPVDLVFALLVPEEATDDHLQILATLASNFNDHDYRQSLRTAGDSDILHHRACTLSQ